MELNEAIRQRIKNCCTQREWSFYRLSKESKVPRSTLSSLMNHETQSPSLVIIVRLCQAFEMDLQQFFEDDLFNDLEGDQKVYEY